MTVIALRDGVMASDSLCTRGDHRLAQVTKIAKGADGSLLGVSGDALRCAEFLRWFATGCIGEPEGDEWEIYAIVARPDGSVGIIEDCCSPFPVEGPFFAAGSGADYAIGAMAAGASAEEAVRIAISHCITCGGPVVSKTLGKQKRARCRKAVPGG
jgi:ATP-dependent HslUV protease subunit HslV